MKKILVLFIVALTLVACGSSKDKDDTPDVTSVASIVDSGAKLKDSLASKGNWITAILNDVTLEEDLTVSGTFHDKGDKANAVYRKLALHTQDKDFNIIDNFTLTVPTLVVDSENFTVFYGTIKGNVIVKGKGFALVGTTLDGDLTFASEEIKDSANLDKDGKGATVTGSITVGE